MDDFLSITAVLVMVIVFAVGILSTWGQEKSHSQTNLDFVESRLDDLPSTEEIQLEVSIENSLKDKEK